MFVRTASDRDLGSISKLLGAVWHDTYDTIYGAEIVQAITSEWHSTDALRRDLDRPSSEFLVADDGVTLGATAYAAMIDKTVELKRLYVATAFQGRGIGTMLLDEIEGCFPEAERLRLNVDAENVRATQFYLAQGFAETARSDEDVLGRETSVITYERPILWA